MNIKILCVTLSLGLLAGCSSGIHRDHTFMETPKVKISEAQKLGHVTISLTNKAKDKLVDNMKFNAETLRQRVESALKTQTLIALEDQDGLPNMEIVIKDMRARSNFSAIAFGFMAGSDSITGDIVLKDANNTVLDRFEVSASYALGGLAGGFDSTRMNWLYEEFAKQTIKELRGLK
ncbi:MAG: DUF4410 domain-containing protein [Mariprofundaceae bacterium]